MEKEAVRAEQAHEEATKRLSASPLYGMYRYSELAAVKDAKQNSGSKSDRKVLPLLSLYTAQGTP